MQDQGHRHSFFKGNVSKILIILFVIVFPHYVPLPFYSYAIVCLGVLYFILRKNNKTFRELGLRKNGISAKAILVGVFSALVWVAFMRWIYLPIIQYFFIVPEYTEYDFIRNHPLNLAITLLAAWLIGGFYEELVFRGFIQHTIENWFGKKHGLCLSVSITSLLFGLYHWQQGLLGIIAATLGGLFWTFLLKRFGGNLWYPILSHAFFDTITLTLIYLGLFGK